MVFLAYYSMQTDPCSAISCVTASDPTCAHRSKNSGRSEEVRVQVVLLAELVCDWDTGQVFAPVTLHGVDVEEDGQGGEEAQKDQQEDTDLDPLPVHIGTPKAEDGGGGIVILLPTEKKRVGGFSCCLYLYTLDVLDSIRQSSNCS